MTNMQISLEQFSEVYKMEQDWLFEKLLGVKEYVSDLGFQLSEKHPDFHTCYIDCERMDTLKLPEFIAKRKK